MRRQIIVMFCGLLLLVFGQAYGEPVPSRPAPDRGALFKLEQGGHVAYLFGTIHVGADDFYPLEPVLLRALQGSSVLALEVDPLGDQAAVARAVREHGMYQGRGSASAELSPAYRPRLARLLKRYAIPAAAAAPMKPWMLASLLTVSEFAAQGFDPALAVDAWLSRRAKERGIKVVELESVAGQMALFNGMTAREQAQFLEEGIAAIEAKQQAGQARELTDAWSNADAKALDALALKAAQDTSLSGKFVQEVLLDGRNPSLADGIAKLLALEKQSFAAIGVLHLVGRGNVPELLRRKGISVERVY